MTKDPGENLLAPTGERALKLLRLAFYLCADLFRLRSIGHAVATAAAAAVDVDRTLWTVVRSGMCTEDQAALYGRRFAAFLDACPGAFGFLTSLTLRNLRLADSDVPNILSTCGRLRELCLKYCGHLKIDDGDESSAGGGSFVLRLDAPSSSRLATLGIVECYFSRVEFARAPRLARLFVETWLDEESPPLRFGHVPQLRHVCFASALLSWQGPFALSACLTNATSLTVVDLNFKDEMIWIEPEDAKLLAPVFSSLKEWHLQEIFPGCDLKWTLLYLEAAPSLNSFHVKVSRHICGRNKIEGGIAAKKTNLLREARDFKHCNLSFVEIEGFQLEQTLTSYTRLVMERATNLKRIRLRGKDECKRCDQAPVAPNFEPIRRT